MHLLTNRIKAVWRAGKVTSVLFLDIEGAFPNANLEKLVHNLRKRKVPLRYANFMRSMLREQVTTLKFDGYTSDHIPINNGIGQGDPLSMVMYQFYNTDLIDIPKHPEEDAEAYVDDTFMLASGKDFPSAHRKLVTMMTRDGGVEDWSKTHSSPLEYSKLVLINFAHSSKSKENPALHLPSRIVQPANSAKYLGVYFDRNLNWKVHQAYTVEKGMKWAAQIRRLTRPTWGVTPKFAKRLYTSVALPRVLYAVDLWCTLLNHKHKGLKTTGSARAIKQIGSIQRAGMLAITGGLRTSPTDALNASAYLLPTPLLIRKWCLKAAVRMATLPKEHLLHKPVNWKVTHTTKRHRGPLHILANSHSLDMRRIEKIPTIGRNPSKTGELPFSIKIPADKEASAREAENAPEEIQVFTDGSAQGGKVRAAAILIGKNRPNRTLHFHLGPETEHMVHEAELVGLLLAMHLIRTERRGATSCCIAVDNQATLKAFNLDLRKPGHHLAREILDLAYCIRNRRSKRKFLLTLRWTAGHIGILGNEKADSEAKRAAAGLSSTDELLPLYLRKPLFINPSAVTRKHNDELKKEWSQGWLKSERGKRASKIDASTPSVKFLKMISNAKLSREGASRIAQLQLQHLPLNRYLHRFRRTDKANCLACGHEKETIAHFLLHCTKYDFKRWALVQQVKKRQKKMTLETLLGDPEMAIPLANYVHSTSRFRDNPGEHAVTQTLSAAQESQNRQS
jgi:ribonuclease HI